MDSQKKYKVVFLYTELAEYFLSCVRKLAKEPFIEEIHVVRWPVNQEAPFDFEHIEGVYFYERKQFHRKALLKLVEKIDPDLIYTSGWLDKGYKKICKKFRTKIPVVLGLDNHWEGTTKQKGAAMLSRFVIKPFYSDVWVPGQPQRQYAKMLGFDDANIHTGFYVADHDLFWEAYEGVKEKKKKDFPKRFVYVARYVEHKGIKELWDAFIQMKEKHDNDWELWCLGTGPLEADKPNHPDIKHLGFVQPKEMKSIIEQTGVFVLPSKFEPWGVAVHEFAAAGFPMLVSEKVGASEAFVKHGQNGYVFSLNNHEEFLVYLTKFVHSSDKELADMGERSYELSKTITHSKWTETIHKLLLQA